MTTTKQRFQCKQCNLIWETIVYPYVPDQKEIRITFEKCPNSRCGSEDFVEKKVGERNEH